MRYSARCRIILVLNAIVLLLGGCIPVSSQNGADLSKMQEFHIEKNVTSEKELVDHFGPPGNTVTQGDGARMLSWTEVIDKLLLERRILSIWGSASSDPLRSVLTRFAPPGSKLATVRAIEAGLPE